MDNKTDEWTDGRFLRIKLEYKQTERQVDFFSDYTTMFVGLIPTIPLCPSSCPVPETLCTNLDFPSLQSSFSEADSSLRELVSLLNQLNLDFWPVCTNLNWFGLISVNQPVRSGPTLLTLKKLQTYFKNLRPGRESSVDQAGRFELVCTRCGL